MNDLEFRPLSASFSVSAQIDPSDLEAIKESGFKSVICNRPDAEEPGQPSFDEIRDAADKRGLATLYLPITHGGMSQDQIAEFETALNKLPGPILAYCRSGARSSMLWSQTKAGQGQEHQNA